MPDLVPNLPIKCEDRYISNFLFFYYSNFLLYFCPRKLESLIRGINLENEKMVAYRRIGLG